MRKTILRRCRAVLFGLCLLVAGLNPGLAAENPEESGAALVETEANLMVEITLTAVGVYEDPFNDVVLDAVVTDPGGMERRVPAFWAGSNGWKFRYASPLIGRHTYRTVCSQPEDKGLHEQVGAVEVKPYTGTNPLYVRGPLQVSDDKRFLEHADGTPFFWLADTWWMGLSKRLVRPEEFQSLLLDRKEKGFNVIQIVMGPPPDSHPFDPRSVNEAGFPWEKEYASIRPEYYDAADERIMYLVDQGFTPCLFGMWGYHMRFMGVDRATQHWRYLIARYAALPVVWCAAGEANLSWYLAPGFPYDDREQVVRWTQVMRYIQEADPFDRLLTNHPTGIGWSARYCTDDVTLLDFDMLQTPHGGREAVGITVGKVKESRDARPTMPVINGEAAYEMLNDTLPTRWTRQMFWLCMMNGAAGHTYGANGIWQCNRPGDPHGPSPHHPRDGVGYGRIPWNEAMNLPGSTQMGYGKALFERYEWHLFQPRSDWAEYVGEENAREVDWNRWIWFPEGEPNITAPVGKRYFRKSFDLPEGSESSKGILRLSVDDGFTAYLNGVLIGGGSDWQSPTSFKIGDRLRSGRNVLAIEAENRTAPFPANPAGLLASLQVQRNGEDDFLVSSDATWLTLADPPDALDWTSVEFNDSEWISAKDLGAYGQAPWGTFSTSERYGPYATGIPGEVRLIYVPEQGAVRVLHLESDVQYHAHVYDPATGIQTELGAVVPDAEGVWTVSLPSGGTTDGDWVLVLEARD